MFQSFVIGVHCGAVLAAGVLGLFGLMRFKEKRLLWFCWWCVLSCLKSIAMVYITATNEMDLASILLSLELLMLAFMVPLVLWCLGYKSTSAAGPIASTIMISHLVGAIILGITALRSFVVGALLLSGMSLCYLVWLCFEKLRSKQLKPFQFDLLAAALISQAWYLISIDRFDASNSYLVQNLVLMALQVSTLGAAIVIAIRVRESRIFDERVSLLADSRQQRKQSLSTLKQFQSAMRQNQRLLVLSRYRHGSLSVGNERYLRTKLRSILKHSPPTEDHALVMVHFEVFSAHEETYVPLQLRQKFIAVLKRHIVPTDSSLAVVRGETLALLLPSTGAVELEVTAKRIHKIGLDSLSTFLPGKVPECFVGAVSFCMADALSLNQLLQAGFDALASASENNNAMAICSMNDQPMTELTFT